MPASGVDWWLRCVAAAGVGLVAAPVELGEGALEGGQGCFDAFLVGQADQLAELGGVNELNGAELVWWQHDVVDALRGEHTSLLNQDERPVGIAFLPHPVDAEQPAEVDVES